MRARAWHAGRMVRRRSVIDAPACAPTTTAARRRRAPDAPVPTTVRPARVLGRPGDRRRVLHLRLRAARARARAAQHHHHRRRHRRARVVPRLPARPPPAVAGRGMVERLLRRASPPGSSTSRSRRCSSSSSTSSCRTTSRSSSSPRSGRSCCRSARTCSRRGIRVPRPAAPLFAVAATALPVLQGRRRRDHDVRPPHHGRHAREHARGRVLVHDRARARRCSSWARSARALDRRGPMWLPAVLLARTVMSHLVVGDLRGGRARS